MDAMGPQFLLYPNKELVSEQGILMGMPLTWITLSLLHIFWVCEAYHILDNPSPTPSSTSPASAAGRQIPEGEGHGDYSPISDAKESGFTAHQQPKRALKSLFKASHSPSKTPRNQPFSICGDDLVGIWTPDFNRAYTKSVQQAGGKFSIGKHYTSKKYGVFTEEIFAVNRTSFLKAKPATKPARPIGHPYDFPEMFELPDAPSDLTEEMYEKWKEL
jgi:hypothetical protein